MVIMETAEINAALGHVKSFKGTFASNSLPEKFNRPAFFVINTERWHESGEHWVAMYFPADRTAQAEYFDPFGLCPIIDDHESYLRRHALSYKYNSVTLQNPYTSSCGVFCCMYVDLRASGLSYADILKRFRTDLSYNEKTVRLFKLKYQRQKLTNLF